MAKEKQWTIMDYQNYQVVRNTVTSLNNDDNWVELGPVFRSPKYLVVYIKNNISSEAMEQHEYTVEYWDDFVTDANQVEWMALEDFIEEYIDIRINILERHLIGDG